MNNEENTRQKKDFLIREWFLLTVIVGGLCLYKLAAVGEASLHSVLFGYSPARILMMAVLTAGILIGLTGLITGRFSEWIITISEKRLSASIAAVLFFMLSFFWIFLGFLSEERLHPYFERLQPLLLYGIFISGTSVLLFFKLRNQEIESPGEHAAIRKQATVIFYIAFALYLFIRVTGVGIVPDEMDWQPNGMAIQYWELLLSLWFALALSVLLRLFRMQHKNNLTTVILFLSVWAAAAFLWVSIPTMKVLDHSYFMEITEPNQLPYPASDAAYYGLWAESILAGLGFKTTVVTRQFLIVLIAFFGKLTHGDILKTIDCFTILLALIPACMYLLGKQLHSHGAGLFAAGLMIFREYNTIWLAPHYMVSNSKMLLSDLPGMLTILAALCAAVSWYRSPRSVWRMLLAGCLTGLSVTVRSQSIILIPFLALCFILQKGLPFKKRVLPAVGFLLAAVMMIAPWLLRSKIITGDFILDEPGIHSTELARRWSDDPDSIIPQQPDENDAEFAARMKQHMIDFFLENPGYTASFIFSHFFANEISALTALPFGTDFTLTIHDVTDTAFHNVESRMIGRSGTIALIFFLVLIALGISAAYKRAGTAGLLPLIMCTLYLFLTACGRYSGWRFALPADWIYYFYFALGTAETGIQIAAALGEKRENLLSAASADLSPHPVNIPVSAMILILFSVPAVIPALSGKLIPQAVHLQSSEVNMQQITDILAPYPEKKQLVSDLCASGDFTVLNGRIIYPRFFYQGQGLSSGHPWTAYKIRDFSRLGFVLLNEENHDVILPVSESPEFIPNAADIYVIGKEDREGFFRAEAIIIPSNESNAVPNILTAENQE